MAAVTLYLANKKPEYRVLRCDMQDEVLPSFVNIPIMSVLGIVATTEASQD